jgi:hypothetical protein
MDAQTPTPITQPVLPSSPRHPTAGERHGHETTRIIRRKPDGGGR